ncbi:triosephosphate isomerase, partial [gut metagenome]
VKLVETLKPLVKNDEVDVVFCVPAIDIIPVVEACKDTNIQVGAENMYFEEKGAYTGEISPAMLTDAGVKYVVLGHSERRDYFGETNEDVNKKMTQSFRAWYYSDHVLRRNSYSERAGRDYGLHPSAG